MSEGRARGRAKSFGEARGRSRTGQIESHVKKKEWAEKYQKQLDDAAKAAQKESEDKGFWGKLATIGTTLGCVALDAATAGMCTIGGLIVGSAARAYTDYQGKAEEMVPTDVDPLDVKYGRADAKNIAESINSTIGDLSEFHANEWKTDVLKQAADTYQAYKLGSGLEKWQGEGNTLFDKLGESFMPTVEEVQLTESAQLMAEDPLKAMETLPKAGDVNITPLDPIKPGMDVASYMQPVDVPEGIPLDINETNTLTQSGIDELREVSSRMQPDVPFNIQEDTTFYNPVEDMIESPGLSSFDEASWTEGAARIEALDRSAALQENLEMGLQINKKLPLSFGSLQHKFKLSSE
jgi:hypothetical protein